MAWPAISAQIAKVTAQSARGYALTALKKAERQRARGPDLRFAGRFDLRAVAPLEARGRSPSCDEATAIATAGVSIICCTAVCHWRIAESTIDSGFVILSALIGKPGNADVIAIEPGVAVPSASRMRSIIE